MNIALAGHARPDSASVGTDFIRRPPWQRAAIVGTPIILLVAAVAFRDSDPTPAAVPAAPQVTVAAPLERTIRQWDDHVGRFEASRTVEVRPRVSGQIVEVHFTDGQLVREGQLLFTIDPRPFTAALAEAHASVASAQAELELADEDLRRARHLLVEEAVSEMEVGRLLARARSARAALAAAQARVRSRSLDVEFAYVRAPIGGRASDRRIDPGNLVASGDTLLTTINALDPIHFSFDVPESLFLKASRARRIGNASAEVAEIRLQDEADYNWKGRLDFTDNGISQNSGTIRTRVVVPNPNYFLAPGMFGNMRLADGSATRALLVPDAAVRTDQARKILLVVGKDDMVAARAVETGPLVGGLRVIRSGLVRLERVVIEGHQYATPGTQVKPKVGQIRPASLGPNASTPFSSPAPSQATLASK